MEIVQTLSTSLVVLFVSIVGGYVLKGRLDRIEARLDRLEARMDALPTREEFNAVNSRLARLEAEVAALRSDLAQIALAVGARLRPQTG